ncbi:MAG: RNA polymerase sigma factor [Lachnospiraceae bacterium]|nr:RNA polymerase sigma factor [Lachnospiraceae bacterium]
MEDNAIIELYFARDEAAIQETQSKYGRYLSKIAHNILSQEQDVEESLNDTYLKTWNSIPPNRPVRLQLYLGKITRELSIDIYRKKHAEKRGGSEYALSLDEMQETLASGSTIEDEVSAKALAGLISTYLKTLSKEKRDIFVCRYYHCDSVSDICANFQMTESKVKNMLLRVRAGLKEYLEKEGYVV